MQIGYPLGLVPIAAGLSFYEFELPFLEELKSDQLSKFKAQWKNLFTKQIEEKWNHVKVDGYLQLEQSFMHPPFKSPDVW